MIIREDNVSSKDKSKQNDAMFKLLAIYYEDDGSITFFCQDGSKKYYKFVGGPCENAKTYFEYNDDDDTTWLEQYKK